MSETLVQYGTDTAARFNRWLALTLREQRREVLQVSQSALAKRHPEVNLSSQELSDIECGRRALTLPALFGVLRLYGLSPAGVFADFAEKEANS